MHDYLLSRIKQNIEESLQDLGELQTKNNIDNAIKDIINTCFHALGEAFLSVQLIESKLHELRRETIN